MTHGVGYVCTRSPRHRKASCIQKTVSVSHYQNHYQKNRTIVLVVSKAFVISHYHIYYHFLYF